MTNDEYFNDKPMKEAIAKWRSDCANGYSGDMQDWLDHEYMDFTKGKIVRGQFYPFDATEEKIRKIESAKVTGYALEWKSDTTGEWFASEFVPVKGSYTNRHDLGEAVSDDWFDNEVEVGFFKELPEAWLGYSDDWDYRLGVDFNADTTPIENPSIDGIWEGVTSRENGGVGTNGEPWRVRKVTIGGELSDKAKEFIRRNPDVVFDFAE